MASFLYTPEPEETVRIMHPSGSHWSLEELQAIVGGYPERLRTIDGRFMVINDEGKIMRPPLALNKQATRIYEHGRRDVILGPALVIDTLEELDGPPDAEEVRL